MLTLTYSQEGNFLFVLGGSLGKLSGYTDSVEMYSVETGQWLEGPKMSSSRYSHCAVGLGNGSIIVTGEPPSCYPNYCVEHYIN